MCCTLEFGQCNRPALKRLASALAPDPSAREDNKGYLTQN